jgi:signal transduction histidine kinase
MPRFTRSPSDAKALGEDTLPDLAELARLHDVGVDLIERSGDVNDLLDGVLEEYERRLAELPTDALDRRGGGPVSPEGAKKLRALMMFATQAIALKTQAQAADELKQRARDLEEANARLETALRDARLARERLDGVIQALDAGILIAAGDGRVVMTNRAAMGLVGDVAGGPLPAILGGVPKGGNGEVSLGAQGDPRVLTVSRRAVAGGAGDEVILLSDVTERDREKDERHRLEKLGEVLRTIGVLSHKINNPLTALLGRAQLLKANKSSDPGVIKAAGVIEESSQRIAELIRELAGVVKEGRQEAVEKILDMSDPTAGRPQ